MHHCELDQDQENLTHSRTLSAYCTGMELE